MKAAVSVFALLCVVNVCIVSSQETVTETWETYSTKCADIPIVPINNFNKEQWYGLWYVQAMYDFTGSDANNCYTSLRLPSAGGKATKLDTYLNLNLDLNAVGSKVRFNGELTFNKPGYGQYVYNSTDVENFYTEVRIIATDSSNYSIEYSCWDVDNACLCWLIILSRDRSLSPTIRRQIDQILDDNGIDRTKLRTVKQDIGSCLGISTGSESGGLLGLLGGLLGLLGGLLKGVVGLLPSILG